MNLHYPLWTEFSCIIIKQPGFQGMQQGLNDPLIRPAISCRKHGIEGGILNSHDMTKQWYEKEELSQMDKERIYLYIYIYISREWYERSWRRSQGWGVCHNCPYLIGLHSLKLTVCPWKWAFCHKKETIVFQSSIFRCLLSVSFREGAMYGI